MSNLWVKLRLPSVLVISIAILLATVACEDDGPSGGFTVTTSEGITDPIFDSGLTINSPVSGIQVIGSYIRMIAGGTPEGNVLNFQQYSTGGSLFVTGGKNPAWWNLAESNGPCGGQSVNAAIVQPQRVANLVCTEASLSPLNVSPQSFNGSYSPHFTVTTTSPLNLTYGPPHLTVASAEGVVYYDQTPDSYTSNTLTVNPGNLSPLYNDIYYVIVSVPLPGGTLGGSAYSTVSIYGNPYGSSSCGLPPPNLCN